MMMMRGGGRVMDVVMIYRRGAGTGHWGGCKLRDGWGRECVRMHARAQARTPELVPEDAGRLGHAGRVAAVDDARRGHDYVNRHWEEGAVRCGRARGCGSGQAGPRGE